MESQSQETQKELKPNIFAERLNKAREVRTRKENVDKITPDFQEKLQAKGIDTATVNVEGDLKPPKEKEQIGAETGEYTHDQVFLNLMHMREVAERSSQTDSDVLARKEEENISTVLSQLTQSYFDKFGENISPNLKDKYQKMLKSHIEFPMPEGFIPPALRKEENNKKINIVTRLIHKIRGK